MARDHARMPSRPFFPVADHQLPKIHVTPEQHEELRAYLLPMVQEVIREGATWGRSNVRSAQRDGWKLTASTLESCLLTKSSGKNYRSSYSSPSSSSAKGGKQQLAASMQTPPTSGQCFMGHLKAPYSLEDVMSSAYGETTEEVRLHYTQTYGSMCLDSCVLKTLEGATLEDPFWYMGIKWLALKSPVKKLVSSREFAYIELTGTHVQQSDGQRMLYRIVQSVNLKGYGGKDSYFGLTRAHIEAAMVYWVDEANSTPERPVLNVCTKGRAHFKGSMPLWLVQLYLKKMWNAKRSLHHDDGLHSTIVTAAAAATAIRATSARAVTARKHSNESRGSIASSSSDSAPLDMATTWVANEERSACYVCQKKFQRVRRPKHHCRSCGEVICRECTSYSKLNVRSLVRTDSSLALLSTGSSSHSNRDFSESNTTIATTQSAGVKHTAKARAPRHVVREAHGMYITVGKVCHRCMELKSIMHNNSTAFQTQNPQMNPWKSGYDAQDEKLRTLHPERDASECGNDHANGDAAIHNNRFAPLGSPCEEKFEVAAEVKSSEGSNYIDATIPTSTKQSRNRRGSLSSMTSSEVCAIIEENGQCELHPIRRRATDSAPETNDGGSEFPGSAAAVVVDTSSAASDNQHDFDDVVDDNVDDDGADNDDDAGNDEEEEEEEDADSNEDLEFKPVVANAVPAHELLANSAAGRDSEISSSLSSFNPDMLFDFQQEFSDDDDDDEDDDENKANNNKTEVNGKKALDECLPPPLSPHAVTLLSPTDSTTLSTSSWPRTRSQRGGSVSISDVQLAIADNAKLLEVLKRERESEEDFEQSP